MITRMGIPLDARGRMRASTRWFWSFAKICPWARGRWGRSARTVPWAR